MWTVNNPLPMDFLNLLFQVSVYTFYLQIVMAFTAVVYCLCCECIFCHMICFFFICNFMYVC
jgi:hypothetical protein